MKTKHIIFFIALALFSLVAKSQCRDTITETFSSTIPTQGGTWATNSMIYGSTTSPNVCASCPRTGNYYLYFNGLGDYIRTPLIPYAASFSFWYRRSSTSSAYHQLIVETSPNNSTWTTQSTITTFTATYVKVITSINNVYVRIRDARTLSSDTKVWYLDDMSWSYDNHIGVWTGLYSNDWNTSSNWCTGAIPTSSDNITIPSGTPFSPVLASGVGYCKNITLNTDAQLTIQNEAKLKVYGNITSNSQINAINGAIELSANDSQSMSGAYVKNKILGSLVINNNSSVRIISDTLKIKKDLSFLSNTNVLYTNNYLYLLSSDSVTARVGEMGNNKIIGNVTVERYIPNHYKAWQFLSVPTIGQTINAAWQEGNVALGNTKPSFGAIITGIFTGSDISTGLPSMKSYDTTTGTWQGITSTSSLINTDNGYMLFVRGDRSVTAYNQPATSTTLRTTGTLYQPTNPPPVISVPANSYRSVNNPYASAIDFSKLTRTGGVQDAFYTWDPLLTSNTTSAYGLGGYQTFVNNGSGYTVVPGGGSYVNGNVNIESGQAFFVKAHNTSGTISFSESSKNASSNLVTRSTTRDMMVYTKMSVVSATGLYLIDGTLSRFSNSYSNDVDASDINKIGTGEGISIIRNSIKLTAESRRSVSRTDTIFFCLNQLRAQTYQLDFSSLNASNQQAKLFDNYLGTITPISLIGSEFLFTVTSDPASSACTRFYLVITGNRSSNLNAKTEEQLTKKESIRIYPNPITNKEFTIELADMPFDNYIIEVSDALGILILRKSVSHISKTSTHLVKIKDYIKPGFYKVIITGSKTNPHSTSIMIN